MNLQELFSEPSRSVMGCIYSSSVPEDEGVRVLCFHHLVPVDMSTRGPGNIGGASEGEIGDASEAVEEEIYQEYNNTHKKYWKVGVSVLARI